MARYISMTEVMLTIVAKITWINGSFSTSSQPRKGLELERQGMDGAGIVCFMEASVKAIRA